MFELYSVPSLTYCVDSLMSFYQNNQPRPSESYTADGLVISLNTASTSVVPILHGKGIMSRAKRYYNQLVLFFTIFQQTNCITEFHGLLHNLMNIFKNLFISNIQISRPVLR